jgi:protein-tyrosine phosphatase
MASIGKKTASDPLNISSAVFSIFNKKRSDLPSDLSCLSCDVHSHLIPGIDDGAPDMESSLRLIRGLIALGYKKIITTPHINADIFPNTPEIIRAGQAAVIAELQRQKIAVEFNAAAEYLMDEHFTRTLEASGAFLTPKAGGPFLTPEAGGPFLTLKDNLILVELSFAIPSINLKEILFNLQLKGYQPVLAHPERYLYFGANKGWYDQIRDAGALFQLNLLSLRGYYGKESQQLAEYLIKKKYVDLLGTDMHNERHLEMLGSSPRLLRTVHELVDAGLVRNATL